MDNLPSKWQSYSAVDALIVASAAATPEAKSFPAAVTEGQSTALAQWIRCGGFLVFSLGQDVDAFHNSPLAEWMPVKVTGQVELRQLGDVESIAGEREPLPRFDSVTSAVISEDAADLDGVVVKRGRSGPTLVRLPYGLGRIALITVDVNLPPIKGKGWKAATVLIENIVKGAPAPNNSHRKRRPGSSRSRESPISRHSFWQLCKIGTTSREFQFGPFWG